MERTEQILTFFYFLMNKIKALNGKFFKQLFFSLHIKNCGSVYKLFLPVTMPLVTFCLFNSFHASGNFCHQLITLVNSLGTDQCFYQSKIIIFKCIFHCLSSYQLLTIFHTMPKASKIFSTKTSCQPKPNLTLGDTSNYNNIKMVGIFQDTEHLC